MSTTSSIGKIKMRVTSGPNAADIVNSLLYAHSPNKLPVRFGAEVMWPSRGTQETEFDAIVTGVKYESGSYGMFLIEFQAINRPAWRACMGFYDAVRRTGTFEFSMSRSRSN